MPAASCTSHAPFSSSALLPAPVPALFFHAEPGWGEGPTPGAPGCPARAPGPRRAHTLPLGSNLKASMGGRPPRAAGRARAAGGRRGGLGAQAEGARLGGPADRAVRLQARRAIRGAASPQRRSCSLCRVPAIRNNVELPGHRVEPRSLLSLSFSHSPSSSLSAALPVMSARRGGVSVNPLLAPTRSPRSAPASAPPRTPSGPRQRRIPSKGRGVALRPTAREMPLRSPFRRGEGRRASRPPPSLTKGGSDP